MLIASKIKIELLRPSAHQVNSQIAWRCKQKSLNTWSFLLCTLDVLCNFLHESQKGPTLWLIFLEVLLHAAKMAPHGLSIGRRTLHIQVPETQMRGQESPTNCNVQLPSLQNLCCHFFLSFCFADCLFTNTDLMKINYKQLTCSLTTQKRHIDSKACGEFSITMARVMSLAPSKSILQNPSAAWKAGEAGKLF